MEAGDPCVGRRRPHLRAPPPLQCVDRPRGVETFREDVTRGIRKKPMLNRHSQTWLSRTAIFLIVVLSLYASGAQAATLTSLSDTMSREKVSTASNHTIRFRTPTGVDAPADTITVDFPSFALGLVAFGDLDLTHGAVTGAETSEALPGAAAGRARGGGGRGA